MAASSSFGELMSPATQPHVFINFRGKDLRKSFIPFLVDAMKKAFINFFIDEQEVGTELDILFLRIEESKLALPIFSKNYTTSSWCLDELAKMKERKDQGLLVVIPIFYKLDPSVVRELRGDFGDKFRDLKRKHLHEPERTKKWKEALTSITRIIGLVLSDQSEKEFVDLIVEKVRAKIPIQGKPPRELEANNIPIEGKPSREVSNQGVFFVPARSLKIEHSEKPENWRWSSVYDAQSEANLEVANLIYVYWLEISGRFRTRNLTPRKKYEVVFMIYLDETADGWEKPTTLKLELEDRDGSKSLQERTLRLDDYLGGDLDIKAGEFEAPRESWALKISFSLHQRFTDKEDRKDGLVVKGVSIRPTGQFTI